MNTAPGSSPRFGANRYYRKAAIAALVMSGLMLLNQFYLWPKSLRREIIVYDVDRPSIFHLTNIGAHRGPDRIDILIDGEIDGKADIYQEIGGGRTDLHVIGPGKVSQRMGGPWHEDHYTLKYEPAGVGSGQLKIHYKFKD